MQSSSKPEGLRCFFKARVEVNELGQKVLALKGQPSFMVSPLLQANAWVVFPESGASAPENSLVQVYPLFPHFDQKEGLCPP
jgi:molybdopterin biosynthesis enzyme